jgi:hypothetical protein
VAADLFCLVAADLSCLVAADLSCLVAADLSCVSWPVFITCMLLHISNTLSQTYTHIADYSSMPRLVRCHACVSSGQHFGVECLLKSSHVELGEHGEQGGKVCF